LAPANPTGNPNFNLKKRPEVNKSGPGATNAAGIMKLPESGHPAFKNSFKSTARHAERETERKLI
jgi:hypothetical protein